MDLNTTKMRLLSHSKNMLVAAENKQWDRYETLNNQWHLMLEESVKQFGNQLDIVKTELLSDNAQVQKLIKDEHQKLLTEFESGLKGISSVKTYLK